MADDIPQDSSAGTLYDPLLARIASLPVPERAAEYEKILAQLAAELETTIGQDTLR